MNDEHSRGVDGESSEAKKADHGDCDPGQDMSSIVPKRSRENRLCIVHCVLALGFVVRRDFHCSNSVVCALMFKARGFHPKIMSVYGYVAVTCAVFPAMMLAEPALQEVTLV